jgi:tetratricopeptide (TPR) repeat protein
MRIPKRNFSHTALAVLLAVQLALPVSSAIEATSQGASSYQESAIRESVTQPSSLTGAFPLGSERLRSSTGATRRSARAGTKPYLEVLLGLLLILLVAGLLAAHRRRRLRRASSTSTGVGGHPLLAARAHPTRPVHKLVERGSRRGSGRSPLAPSRNPPRQAMLGRGFERRGKLEAAEAAYRRASDAGSVGGAYNLGVLLHDRADLEGAESAYRTAAGRGDAEALLNLGLLLYERGDLPGAENVWRRADARGNRQAAASLGCLLLDRGDLPGALAAHRRAEDRGDARGAAHLASLISKRSGQALRQ